MKNYPKNFFDKQKVDSYQSAQVIVPLVLDLFPSLSSVIDIGCGLGAWLKVFAENGIDNYLGVDGKWVDQRELLIPQKKFVVQELEQDFNLSGKYDLSLCLEVAEHLPASSSDKLVHFLTNISQIILFSAAIPGQDLYAKMLHLNEQWPEYWAKKFFQFDFYPIDLLRDKIWFDERVKYWYRQNILFFVSQEFLNKNSQLQNLVADSKKLARVHPKTYREVLKYYKNN
jgi:SAM-dependent methyltransferase